MTSTAACDCPADTRRCPYCAAPLRMRQEYHDHVTACALIEAARKILGNGVRR